MTQTLPRNLAFDLVRSTEAAAIAAGRWIGMGEKDKADRIATEEMIQEVNKIDMDGHITVREIDEVIESLINQKHHVGTGKGPKLELVMDAIDGTSQLSRGSSGAISAAAIAPAGTIKVPEGASRMRKVIVNSTVAPALVSQCCEAPPAWTLALIARAKKREISKLTVFVLDRPRHKDLVNEIHAAGAHVMLAPDGDIAGGILACSKGTGVDLLMGIGGVVEGILVACAVKATRGKMIFQYAPQSEAEKTAIQKAGYDIEKVYSHNDLVQSDEVVFTATGINNGPLLDGVRYDGDMAITSSLLLSGKSRTRRLMKTKHTLS